MRRVGRIDANQPDIVKELRKAGASVQVLSNVGGGCPDLLAGYMGVNWLIEVKDGSKPPSARKLTPDQEAWHKGWRGTVYVVSTIAELLEVIRKETE